MSYEESIHYSSSTAHQAKCYTTVEVTLVWYTPEQLPASHLSDNQYSVHDWTEIH